jgi:hypothetical protein
MKKFVLKCKTCGPVNNCNCSVSYTEYLKLIDLLIRLQPWVDYPTPSELISELATAISEGDTDWVPCEIEENK